MTAREWCRTRWLFSDAFRNLRRRSQQARRGCGKIPHRPVTLADGSSFLSAALWVSVLVLSLGLAYAIVFSEVTLALGRTLSDNGAGRGYQDAVTPPWQARLGSLIYVLTLIVIAFSWYEFGIGRAIGTVVVLFVGSMLWRRVLPQGHSTHYLKLIVTSMARRYADWVRSGDAVRAAAMAELLAKMGLDLPGNPRRPQASA
jgi:hypothetical protein